MNSASRKVDTLGRHDEASFGAGALVAWTLPAQQVQITGFRAEVREASMLDAAEAGDSYLLTLPGPVAMPSRAHPGRQP